MAHTLLFKENPTNDKLRAALYCMSYEIGTEELLKAVDNEKDFTKLVKIIVQARSLHDISGNKNPMYHKKHSEKTRKIMSEKKKGKYCGKENPHWGKRHTEEMKQKLSLSRMGGNNPAARKVYCPELDMVFDTVAEALKYVGIKNGIVQCCSSKYNRITAGRHPETKEKLHWFYVDE